MRGMPFICAAPCSSIVGGIERGERNVALLNIVGLADALKVKPSELMRCLDL
jgi:hypothetical protein